MSDCGRGRSTGASREIWLLMCKEGGRWTPEEMAEALNKSRHPTARKMHTMAGKMKQLKRFKEKGRALFGVTSDCLIPFGITVKELAEVGVLTEEKL
jgi:hypothetical protein